MSVEESKEILFDQNGYIYKAENLCYINRKTGKIFTYAYISDNSTGVLQSNINEPHREDSWKIYYSPDQEHFIQNYYNIFGPKP